MKLTSIVVIGVGVLSAACATTPIPADKLSRSSAAIRGAEVSNANQNPAAATHLGLARQQVTEAKQLLKAGENERAGYVLLRAEADAEAAMNLAREGQAKQDAAQTIESVRMLKAQLEVPQS